MNSEIAKLHARIRELEDELSEVRAEAVEAVEFWGGFASNYSKVHHGLAEDIRRLRGHEYHAKQKGVESGSTAVGRSNSRDNEPREHTAVLDSSPVSDPPEPFNVGKAPADGSAGAALSELRV
jgi:hypothetical protein